VLRRGCNRGSSVWIVLQTIAMNAGWNRSNCRKPWMYPSN
jgi:hypothetical protein